MKSPDPQTASPEELLSHAKWVRSLAQSLLADSDLADDVAQDSILVALEKRPYGGKGLKSWFAQVVRGLAHNSRRSDRRRRRREWKVGSAPSDSTSSEDIMEWAEHMHELALAISRLESAHRDIITKIYFEEKRPAQIAREEGIPAGTIRSRHQRALQKLRAELKSQLGPNDWVAGIGLLAAPFSAPSAVGWTSAISATSWISKLTIMNTKIKLAASAVLISLVGLAVWPSDESVPAIQNPELSLADATLNENATAANFESAPAVEAPESRQPDQMAPTPADGTIEIRVLDQAGNPIPGVSVSGMIVHMDWLIKGMPIKRWAWTATPDSRERSYAITGPDGIAQLTGLKRSSAVLIHGRKAGFALAGSIAKRDTDSDLQKLTDLILPPGGAVSFEVVDEGGNGVPNATIEIQTDPITPVGILTWQNGETDAAGKHVFPYLTTSIHGAKISANGFVTSVIESISPGIAEAAHHKVIMKRGLAIVGRVVDNKGNPVVDVPIYLVTKGDFGHSRPERFSPRDEPWTQTDSHGMFVAEGLESGTIPYRLIAIRSNTVRGFTELIEAGTSAEITLPVAHKVSGKIVNPDGTPTKRGGFGFVNVRRPDEQGQVFHAAENDGSFEVLLGEGTFGGMVKSRDGDFMLEPFEVKGDVDLGVLKLNGGVPLIVTTLSSLDQSPVDFPNHSLGRAHPSFLDETVFDPSAWRRRIRFEAGGYHFSFPKHLEDHVIQYNQFHPGKFDLISIKTGYLQKTTEVELVDGELQELTIYLDPAAMVDLKITSAEGLPAADREFQLTPILSDGSYDESRFSYRETTDSAGIAKFTQIGPGLVRLGDFTRFTIKPGQNEITYQLPPQAALTLVVRDSSGPVQGVRTNLSRVLPGERFPFGKKGETNANGEFEYVDLFPGTYRIRLEQEGSPTVTKNIEFRGSALRVDLQLVGVSISGNIPSEHLDMADKIFVSLSGYPMSAREMETVNPDTLGQTHWQTSSHSQVNCSADGSFEFTNVPPGIYFVRLWTWGYRSLGSTQLKVYTDSIEDVGVPGLIKESKVVVKIVDLGAFIAKHPADYFYARLYDGLDREVGKVSFEGNGEREIGGLSPGACTLKISSIQRPSMEETVHATIPVLVGEPGTSVIVQWPPESEE